MSALVAVLECGDVGDGVVERGFLGSREEEVGEHGSADVNEILSCFLSGKAPDPFEYTKGHFKKGIE